MDINVNHPNFIVFLDNVSNTILAHVTTTGYFALSPEKKLGMQYIVFKLMKTSLRIKGSLTTDELKSFTVILCKKNEENENYELAAILNDIIKNFDSVNEKTTTVKPHIKMSKTDVDKKT
jgi:hypothetical protein